VPSDGAINGYPAYDVFKRTYVLERRFYEQRTSTTFERPEYRPSPRWDGTATFESPEERPPRNEWKHAYDALLRDGVSPHKYLRVIFRECARRGLTPPQPNQVTSRTMRRLYLESTRDCRDRLARQYVWEAGQARQFVLYYEKLHKMSLSLAVYRTVHDQTVELSPLFEYCLLVSAYRRPGDKHERALLRKSGRLLRADAVLQYVEDPDLYDDVWRYAIPKSFSSQAQAVLQQLLRGCGAKDEGPETWQSGDTRR